METEVCALRKAKSFQVVAENLIAFSGFEIFLGTYIDRPTIWTPYNLNPAHSLCSKEQRMRY